jgi:hypothetical protein
MNLVREPDAGNPPVRFDEREVETEHGMRLLRHRRGNPDPEYAEAYPTAPPLDSTRFFSYLQPEEPLKRRGMTDVNNGCDPQNDV